jgi:hypothetical protein
MCINAATSWALWPSLAADAFRVYDGTAAAAMLGADIVDGTEFHSALDEAYAYSAMDKGGAASGVGHEYAGAL